MKEIKNDLLFLYNIASSCDYIWPPHGERYETQWKHLNKGLVDFSNIKPYSIIYADLTVIYQFSVFYDINVPFILVSGENDYSVPFINYNNMFFDNVKLLENKNLVKWFSINIDFNHPKLVNIPIGLPKQIPLVITEDDETFIGWSICSNTSYVNDYIKCMYNSYYDNFQNKYKKLLYCRMTIGNSKECLHKYLNIREESVNKLKGICDIDTSITNWYRYINELKDYKFCLSLPGKGLDCYRTWEALSLGVIPIVLNTSIVSLYADLPVLVINDVSEITEEFLNDSFERITKNMTKYKFEKLTSYYWINIIKQYQKTSDFEKIRDHVEKCIENAELLISNLNDDILNYKGFSGNKTRHFYNNICSMNDCKYLEIGTWYGSSSISSLYCNNIEAVFIDNWSLFDGNKDIFINAVEKYKGVSKYKYIDSDCFKIDVNELPKFNVYLYDGGHTYSDHYNAIKHYIDNLSDNCIIMIDDWNWEEVQKGTLDAFSDLKVQVKYRREITTHQPHYDEHGQKNWWNGIGIFII